METAIPRPEHPEPQFERADWLNLNGTWTFAFDPGRSGKEKGWIASQGFDRAIRVPFCPESALSGVGHTDFIEDMWYHRVISPPEAWAGKRILLHFGAVDFYCEVYMDGALVGRHWGGSSAFRFDITARAKAGGRHHLVLRVHDQTRSRAQTGGKQCHALHSYGCHYTRTTGIWQTVWLEAVAGASLENCRIMPDLTGGQILLLPSFRGLRPGLEFRARAFTGEDPVAEARRPAGDGLPLVLRLPEPRAWSPEDPFLYRLQLEVLDGGQVTDTVRSYAGLREIRVEGSRLLLNGRPIYLRLVLDQGFYPDGVWTAPSDEALRRDIQLAQAAGFNGARLHQKAFEPRFHYWADRLGYLTWAESASWGLDMGDPAAARNFLSEWAELVERDRNHPSIIAWTPFNETSEGRDAREHDRLVADAYALTKALDPGRPVNDTSGYRHVRTDLYTVHNYEPDPAKLLAQLTPAADGAVWINQPGKEAPYSGQPYLVDEFGGIKWDKAEMAAGDQANHKESWGYGRPPASLEEFYHRLEGQLAAISALPHVAGYCYTQLTDVEQERNGIYGYDRGAKFDLDRVRAAFAGSGPLPEAAPARKPVAIEPAPEGPVGYQPWNG